MPIFTKAYTPAAKKIRESRKPKKPTIKQVFYKKDLKRLKFSK